MRVGRLLAVGALVGLALPVQAQSRPPQPTPRSARPFVERGYVTIGAGAQAPASTLTDRIFFESNAETATIEARYPSKAGLLVDAGAGMRVRGRIGIGLAFNRATTSGRASVSAELPHPFFDNRHRTVDGDAGGISRIETAAHVQVYYDLRPRGKWRARLFAGPSYIHVEQEVVTEVDAAETYPYDTAEFRSALTARAKGSGIGFNAGADLGRMLSGRVGANLLLRYARANTDLNAPGSRDVSTNGGGFQAGAGLRILF